jgi:hypothetical protein
MLRLSGITVDSPDPVRLARFWEEALGYEQRPLWGRYVGLKDPQARGPHLTLRDQRLRRAGTYSGSLRR